MSEIPQLLPQHVYLVMEKMNTKDYSRVIIWWTAFRESFMEYEKENG
jgi:hypothetical protein